MKVHLNQIPPEGLHLEGEESSDLLELKDASVRAVSPVRYALDIGYSGSSFFATGKLEVDLELECVSCLERFPFPLVVENFAMQTDLDGSETVDLTPYLREDILLVLPPYPHCDWSGDRVCKGARSIDQSHQAADHAGAWDELDKLKTGKNYGSTQT